MRIPLLLLALAALPTPAAAQDRLTLTDAIEKARAANPAARAAQAAEAEAGTRVRQAQGAWLPRVDVTESVQRGDQPVYVFSSLLAQRRFTADHFGAEALTHPDALTNHRAAITIGRATGSTLALRDDGVSSRHAEIRPVGRDWIVVDVGSKNGTFVNDELVVGERRLVTGDVISAGGAKVLFNLAPAR